MLALDRFRFGGACVRRAGIAAAFARLARLPDALSVSPAGWRIRPPLGGMGLLATGWPARNPAHPLRRTAVPRVVAPELVPRLVHVFAVFRSSGRVEQATTVGAGAQGLASPDRRIELRRKAEVAAATVRAAHRNDHGAATHQPESVVHGKKDPRDRLAERHAALFEREDEAVHQCSSPGELIIDRGEICEGADGPIHCSSVRRPGLRLDSAFRRGDGLEDGGGVGSIEDGLHGVLVREHL